MKWLKRALPVIALLFSFAHAQDLVLIDPELFTGDNDERRLLEPFLEEQREKPLADKPNLRISGDVRARYRWRSERINGEEITVSCGGRNNHPGKDYSDDRDTIEFNLLVDYETECTWASAKVEFENEMGKISGTGGGLDLERALIGYTLYECGETRWFIEVGRDRLGFKFASELQYGSRMDGIYTWYGTKLGWADFHAHAAAMILDYRCDEYAWIGAVGLDDMWCRGWYVKYSYIDWARHRSDDILIVRETNDPATDGNVAVPPTREIRPYRISQLIVGRKLKNCGWCRKDLHVYGGFLYNHSAIKRFITRFRKENIGFYLGFQYGKIAKCRDWAVRLEFDYLEAQAILESDNNGIGRGNAARSSLFQARFPNNARSNTNYYGPSFMAGYAITDQFTVRMTAVTSRSIDDNIGGRVTFKEVQLQGIYAF